MATSPSSAVSIVKGVPKKQHQVFINFRGREHRNGFISHLAKALEREEINYYIDTNEVAGTRLEILYERIEESDIALAVFSKGYSESSWCLNELVKIMENVEAKRLRVIPIFFGVTADNVRNQNGEFGDNFSKLEEETLPDSSLAWKKALRSAVKIMGLSLKRFRSEHEFVAKIVADVKDSIAIIEGVEEEASSLSFSGNALDFPQTVPRVFEMEKCLKYLEANLDFDCQETQIVGIVGMPGIGKTTLAKTYFDKLNKKFLVNEIVQGFRENLNDHDWGKNKLLNAQLHRQDDGRAKVFAVLDDVSDKKQLAFLRTNPELVIERGSKILITTRDKGLIKGLVDNTYLVPGLNDKEALQLFAHHAFDDQDYPQTESFINMCKTFVEYAGGNPQALKELGNEVCGKNEAQWKARLETLPHRCNENIRRELRISYEELTAQQKHAFLDIACFFISEQEDYVRTLLDSYETNSGEAAWEVKDLVDKFFISIYAGRIEMHNLLRTMGKEIGSSFGIKVDKSRLWNHQDALEALLSKKEGTYNGARGLFLDTSKIATTGIPLEKKVLIKMPKLRYLKIFDSRCPQQCKDCKVNLPEGLVFPLKEIRYLHWLKFPLEDIPSDFEPENLIDLRLPYSKIQRVWRGTKETPKLKWVDLSHSTKLIDISALSQAESLRRLNLEGCTMLDKLPQDMENMKSLAFLNLRGCTSLSSLPEKINLISLRTLILSGCSTFKDFQVISKNLEYLHLDGTAIKGLPPTIQNIERLIVLNLKDCKKLDSLPNCLDKLKVLEELILSGCSELRIFPNVKETMENLQILLLDGTSIKELPEILSHCVNNSVEQVAFQAKQPQMNGLSQLRHLCLRRNGMICSLQSCISQLYHLKWIDLKYCKNLTSISTLPPNLHCLDAHECTSLKTVASPLALLFPLTDQVSSSFIFTNCEKLEHVAKNEIVGYAHNKNRLISDALKRQNKGLAFEALVATCFPGSEVPTWFNHKNYGAVLEPELPPHWSESGYVGIALCAVVSFQDYKIQNNNLMVKCICKFNNVVGMSSSSLFNRNVGGLSEAGDEKRTVKSTHVFIGFTSWLNINKYQGVGRQKGCNPTKASIKFEVIDGTSEAVNCEVLKCGFSLVCEYDNGSWDANVDATQLVCESANCLSDAIVMAEEDRQGKSSRWGLLRRFFMKENM